VTKGEIIIDEDHCQGCGYCVKFCSRGCITITGNKFNSQGHLLPDFSDPEKCNACGICSWMCPGFAIEVYKFVEREV